MAVAMSSRNAMVELNGEFREVKSLPNTLSGAENAIRDAFGFGTGATLLLQWVDDDGDTITVSSNEEWLEALNAKADLSLTVKASGDLTIVRNDPPPEQPAAGVSVSKDETEEWIVVDPSEAASARNSMASDQAAAQAEQAAAAAASEAAREREEQERAAKEQEEQERKEQEEEQRVEQARKDREELERRAQLEAEDLRKAQELQEEENRRAEEQRKTEAADALQAAAEAEAIAASSYDLVHPPRAAPAAAPAPGPPAELGIDQETWALVKQLEEMGFGQDHKKLSKVLKDHRLDVTSAIEALAAEAAVAEGESGPRVAV